MIGAPKAFYLLCLNTKFPVYRKLKILLNICIIKDYLEQMKRKLIKLMQWWRICLIYFTVKMIF